MNRGALNGFALNGRSADPVVRIRVDAKGYARVRVGGRVLAYAVVHSAPAAALSGPLGRGAARLTGREGAVTLEVAGQGRYQAESPEALLEQQLGWRLPVSHLLWWVRGLPAPDSKSRLTLDGDSHLARLEQDGWNVEYSSYAQQDGYWLPERLKLHGQDLDVTLVIKSWQPRLLGQAH